MFKFDFEGLKFNEIREGVNHDDFDFINPELLKEVESMEKEEDLNILDLPISKLIDLEEQ